MHDAEKRRAAWRKLLNFWDYHKWLLLIGTFLLVLGGYGVCTALAQKETAFSGVLVNFHAREESTLAAQFAQYAQLDTKTCDVLLDDGISITADYTQGTMAALQAILARIHAGELDVLAADAEVFRLYANSTSEILMDLRQCLDAELLRRLDGRIYYIDRAFGPAVAQSAASEAQYAALEFPDPFRPEEMEDPIPVGIAIDDLPRIQALYGTSPTPRYLGVVSNTRHAETAAQFVAFLLD